MTTKPKGNALAIALMVLAILVVLMVAVGTLGAQHLSQVRSNLHGATAVYAAEAGIAASLVELRANSGWSAGFQNVPIDAEFEPTYSVEVFNNFLGGGPISASDGTSVPAGCTYLLGMGTCRGGSARKVAVMLTGGGGGGFRYAIASGGDIEFQAAGDIHGSIKANRNITFQARVEVIPLDGLGRVLCAYDEDEPPPLTGNILIGSNLVLDPAQDIRARNLITGTVQGTTLIYFPDTTTDTLPFVQDGSTSPIPPAGHEQQEVLPNPDLTELLEPGNYVNHPESSYPNGKDKTLELDGQIHYFPNGLTMNSGTRITGSGTIVVGNGNSAYFHIPLDHTMNVVALDQDSPTTGTARIEFAANTVLRGLVYCHGTIESKAHFEVDGTVVAYGTGRYVHSGAHIQVIRQNLDIPGFEGWFSGGGGAGGFELSSWQRL
ncbi:MAG: pilus assembly PilX N-terminal domain-containing protein [Candidatus Eremiobacterota bacterium]